MKRAGLEALIWQQLPGLVSRHAAERQKAMDMILSGADAYAAAHRPRDAGQPRYHEGRRGIFDQVGKAMGK